MTGTTTRLFRTLGSFLFSDPKGGHTAHGTSRQRGQLRLEVIHFRLQLGDSFGLLQNDRHQLLRAVFEQFQMVS
jgi:hypothetical protein